MSKDRCRKVNEIENWKVCNFLKWKRRKFCLNRKASWIPWKGSRTSFSRIICGSGKTVWSTGWNWQQDTAKKLKNEEEFAVWKLIRGKRILLPWISFWLRFRTCKKRWILWMTQDNVMILKLRAALEKTHVPSQPTSIPNRKGMINHYSCLQPDTQNSLGTSGYVFESPPAGREPSWAPRIARIWHRLLADCGKLGQATCWKKGGGVRQEP